MCGFIGYLNLDGRPADEAVTRAMGDRIAHRGPDGDGYWTDGPISLGHRRLAIIDLSEAANQPMHSRDGRYVIVYNGEIYNFRDLRRNLEARGARFETESDTEVLLTAFELDGPDAFLTLNGMFTLAIFDRKLRCLTIARDRFGVKPLYIMQQGKVLAFASEAKAFRDHPDLTLSLDPNGLAEYLTFMNFISDATLFKDVKLFPAGSYVQVDLDNPPSPGNGLRPIQFWDYSFTGDDSDYDAEPWIDEIYAGFTTAVERQLISDVGRSAYLSGGVDSGSITAVASAKSDKLRTFTAFFDYEGATESELKFDERAAAQLMARRFGTEHHEILIGPNDFIGSVPALCDHLDEPRVGQSYPNYLVSGLARRFETVALSGAGGDELFGGYPWRYYQGLPANNFGDYVDGYYAYWRRLAKTDAELAQLTAPIGADVSGFDGRAVFESIYPQEAQSAKRPEELLNWSLYFEAKTFLNGLLVVEDKVAMAHGLETRVPFLDNDLVDIAGRVPIQAKLNGIKAELALRAGIKAGTATDRRDRRTDGKFILRQMMERLVPEEIYTREKQGFSAPDGTWFRGAAYPFLRDALVDRPRRLHDFVDIAEIEAVLEGHRAGTRTDGRHKLWAFLHLSEVIENFGL